MKTEFSCSQCGELFNSDRNLIGRRVRCLTCGLIQRIAVAREVSSAAPGSYELAPALSRSLCPPHEKYSPPPTSRSSHRPRSAWLQHVRPWIFETSQVQGIGAWLVALSAADLLMTFVLLRKSPAYFEANPIAQWFFAKWNITGMVFFKFSMIAGVILLSEIIERNRPGWGRFVLWVGCIGAAYAVFTGGRLYMSPDIPMTVEVD